MVYFRMTNGDMHYPLKLSLNRDTGSQSSTSSSTAGLSPQTPVTPVTPLRGPLPSHVHVCHFTHRLNNKPIQGTIYIQLKQGT